MGKVWDSIVNTIKSNVEGFISQFGDLPGWYQLAGIFLICIILFYIWLGFNLTHKINLEIRSESSPDKKITAPIEIKITGPKKMESLKLSRNGKIENLKIHFGKHNVEVFSPANYEISENHRELIFNKYNKDYIIKVKELEPFKNKQDSETERIDSGGGRIIPSVEKITLYTIIKSIGSKGNKPLENLTVGNFKVNEKHEQKDKDSFQPAKILGLKPLSSPIKCIIVLDNSATIGTVRNQVIEAVKVFLDVLKTNVEDFSKSKIAVLPISRTTDDQLGDYLYHSSTPSINWFNFNEQDLNQLNLLIQNKMKPDELGIKTPLWDGIESALNKLINTDDDESYKFILCITDGINDGGKIREYKTIKNLLETKYSEIPIFSVGYGGSQGLKSEELIELSKISKAGGKGIGSFMDISPKKLVTLYKEIAESINKSYQLSWEPTIKDIGVPVNVSIEIRYEGKKGEFSTKIDRMYIIESNNNSSKEVK